MLLWYAAGSVLIVWAVFKSHGVDYRLVALGALLPLVVDAPFGRPAIGHTLLAAVVVLAAVMLATIGRPRLLRRRLLCLPIGMMCGLVLAGAWTNTHVLWWPTIGASFPHRPLLPAWGVVALEEAAGLAAIAWMIDRFGLRRPDTRREFLRTGRLTAAPKRPGGTRSARPRQTPRPSDAPRAPRRSEH
ncbi:MAG: hypothetical protein JOZ99_06795, partial [Actinobacteria bacterium]|nr:hypothetical protein [Actinomycetota bacterium]